MVITIVVLVVVVPVVPVVEVLMLQVLEMVHKFLLMDLVVLDFKFLLHLEIHS